MTDADVFELARAELARARAKYPAWPIMPELNGVDMFGHLPVAGDE